MPEKQPGQYNSKSRGWFRSNSKAPRSEAFSGKNATPASKVMREGSLTGKRGAQPKGSPESMYT